MFYFYILKCKDGSLYCGSAKDLMERVKKHNAGAGSKYVRSRGGGKVVYFERFKSWNKTLRREAQIKKLSRASKLTLVKSKKMEEL